VLLAQGLWYAGGMEEVSAGIEMASVMGRNVAELIFAQWRREGKFQPEERRIPREMEGRSDRLCCDFCSAACSVSGSLGLPYFSE
jgi:hypothetical protein